MNGQLLKRIIQYPCQKQFKLCSMPHFKFQSVEMLEYVLLFSFGHFQGFIILVCCTLKTIWMSIVGWY